MSPQEMALPDLAETLRLAAVAGAGALLIAPKVSAVLKEDGSPVTPADLASDAAIRDVLAHRHPDIPIVSEEKTGHFREETAKAPFFLVDPLDGTKEYLAGHAEFAVCIALIKNQRPVAGIVLAPLMRKAWLAVDGMACSFELDGKLSSLEGTRQHLAVIEKKSSSLRLVTSRSHTDERSQRLLQILPGCQHAAIGSAIKFASVATGAADLYPRGTGSMEWDTAAGEAIITAAGGSMLGEDGKPMLYGKWQSGFRNRPFIAGSSTVLVREALAQWEPC